MRVQVWRSFAANNSSSYYLVARFADRDRAEACADELRAYLEANEAELASMTPDERSANRELTLANLEFADELADVEWPTHITSGYAEDIDIEVSVFGREMSVYHDYCLGFDDGLTAYLKKRGADVDPGRYDKGMPSLSVVVFRPADELLAELHEVAGGTANARFEAANAVGMYIALDLVDSEALTGLLGRYPDVDLEVALDRPGDAHRFGAAVPGDQIACPGCGGMFELDALGEEE